MHEDLVSSILPSLYSRSVVIVPIFFLTDHVMTVSECDSIVNCTALSSSHFPRNRTEIVRCLKGKGCTSNRGAGYTHVRFLSDGGSAKTG